MVRGIIDNLNHNPNLNINEDENETSKALRKQKDKKIMMYETKVNYTILHEDGKEVKRNIGVVVDCELFAEAEMKAMEFAVAVGVNDAVVTAIKLSPIREVINKQDEQTLKEELLHSGNWNPRFAWKIILEQTFTDEKGKTKRLRYPVLQYTDGLLDEENAQRELHDYLRGIDPNENSFRIVSVSKTNIVYDII